jgi:hypothetical protein
MKNRGHFSFMLVLSYLAMGCGETLPLPTPDARATSVSSVARVPTSTATPTLAPYPLTSPLAPSMDATPSFSMPACAPKVTTISAPTQTPSNFPWPRNLQIYRAIVLNQDTANVQLQIIALAPLSLADAARFVFDALPKASYQVLSHEEEPTESEGLFRGNGWRGSWRINTILNCKEATTWVIILVKL